MKILLLGLGRANTPLAEYLTEKNHIVYYYEEHSDFIPRRAQDLINQHRIIPYKDEQCDIVVSSPGFSEDNRFIKALKAKKFDIIDEIEFTYNLLNKPTVIAVTGTNGKSTTVTLISHILKSAGINNFLGGNIAPGRPFSHSLFEPPYKYYCLEVSSFQLTRIKKFKPHIAVITNITDDHLNWHHNLDEYINAKFRILMNQNPDDFAVLNYDDKRVREFASRSRSNTVFFGTNAHNGIWFHTSFYHQEEKLFSVKDLPLKGKHNLMNIAAAIAVTRILDIPVGRIETALKTFKSLPHRLEEIGVIDGVRYINNSMCTNEAAAIASFNAIPGNKIVIVGGKHKGSRGKEYLKLLVENAKACIILGENADFIKEFFESQKYKNFRIAHSMKNAVELARTFAAKDDTILLNPGYASFDYFKDFEERGEAFKNAVQGN